MKKIFSIFLLLIYIFTLCSCSSKPKGADKSFSYYLDSSVTSLDPQTLKDSSATSIIAALFEGLCRIDENGAAVPGIAKAWFSNADKTQYTFLLRSDAKWSNGELVTAYDFKFAIERAVDPNSKSTDLDDVFNILNAKDVYNGLKTSDELGINVISDTAIQFTLENSRDDFPQMTSGIRFMPCNQIFFSDSAGRYGLEPEYLTTNGPFEFYSMYSWEKGNYLRLSKFTSYYNSSSTMPSELYFYASTPKEIAENPVSALINGNADILKLSESNYAAALEAGCSVFEYNNGVTGLLFNSSAEYLESEAFRELFVKTIDRESLTKDLPINYSIADDIVSENILWNGSSYRKQAESKLYVKEDDSITSSIQSLLQGLELSSIPSITITCPNDELSINLANQVIISWNSKIGSYFNILPLDESEYQNAVYSKNYQVLLYTVDYDGFTPSSVLKNFESSASPQLLDSQAYDTLFMSAYSDIKDYVNLEKLINNQCIFYPILDNYCFYGINPKINDISVSPSHTDFKNATK